MRKNILLVLVGVILCALAIGAYMIYKATNVPVEPRRADEAITAMDVIIEEERKARELHERETVEKVVIIREQVREEVLALGPDGLVDFALGEIREYRRSAGRDSDPSASGMDGTD